VASAFDFYENMRSDIPRTAIQQLVFCVLGVVLQTILDVYNCFTCIVSLRL
jgi:hypothetical protein